MNISEKLGITPGPWENVNGRVRVSAPGISVIVADCCCSGIIPIQESEANIKLIAAAPEMFEALIKIQFKAESIYNTEISETYYRNIIEKATGKTWEEIKTLNAEGQE